MFEKPVQIERYKNNKIRRYIIFPSSASVDKEQFRKKMKSFSF